VTGKIDPTFGWHTSDDWRIEHPKSCTDGKGARIESRWEEVFMQAAVVPAVSSSWQVKDVPQPQPGPNQVLVKMHASGICYTDVH
jgi:hypothetical protein